MSAVVLLSSGAHAAGLGKLTVLSSLGQPLRAEIELTSVSKEEAGSITARLAPMEAYRQANIDFNPALQSLQFSVEQRNGRQFIRLTSTQPINEPFVDMLLELGTNTSRLLREYTFLLDPAEVKAAQAPQTVAPASPAGLAQQGARPAPAGTASSRAATASQQNPAPAVTGQTPQSDQQAPATAARNAAPEADEYKVRSGDSLAQIAGRVKPDAVSLDQMLVSLFNANPDAFVGRNMNRLRAGEILKVPDAQTAGAVSPQEARQVIRTQAADFNEYRNRLANQVAASRSKKAAGESQSSTGRITSSVDEATSTVDASQDKLKVSKAGASGSPAGGASPSSEELIAKDKALAEANSRVQELEKNLADLQTLLQFKSKELAERQQQAQAATDKPAANLAPAASTAGTDAVKETAEATAQKPNGDAAASSPSAAPASGEPNTAGSSEPAAAAAPVAPAATIPQSPASETQQKPQVDAAAKKAVPEPAPETSFLDELLASPLLLPAAGFLTLALGAFGAYQRRRRAPAKKIIDADASPAGLKANSMFAATGGQSIDTSNSVFNSSFSPSASQLDANEVDPVAEADVYIAYGRDAQAEEILKEALRSQPERHAVRLKLLEIYAGRKDLRAFETHATELYGQTKGQGEDWQQAVRLGRDIDPRNPLYGGARDTGDIDSKINDAESMMGADVEAESPADDSRADAGQPFVHAAEQPDAKDDMPALDFPVAVPADVAPQAADAEPQLPEGTRPASVELETTRPASSEFEAEAPARAADANPLDAFKAQLDSLSFDLNSFSVGQADGTGATGATDAKQDSTPESITVDSLDFNLDLPAASPAEPTSESGNLDDVPVLTNAAGRGTVSLGDQDSLASADAAASKAPMMGDMMDFDLSAIDLDLPGRAAKASEMDADLATVDAADVPANPEMSTKLDLAAAYQEIGDKEGARELLDEVVQGGTPGQIAEARRMLEKLA